MLLNFNYCVVKGTFVSSIFLIIPKIHPHRYMLIGMKDAKVVGITLILLIIIGILPINIVGAEEQPIEVVDFYKIILSRTLDIPNLPPELKEKIDNLLKLEPKTTEEATGFIQQVQSILKEVEKVVEEKGDVGKAVEQKKLTLVIITLINIAQEVNATTLVEVLTNALEMANKGDVKGAKNLLSKALKGIEEIKARRCSEAVERSAVKAFEHIPANETAVNAIMRAISNINTTIEILKALKEKLIQTNASTTAIEALERVVSTLNSTTEILKSVAKIVQTAGAERKVENVTKTVAIKRILSEVEDLRENIDELLNKTVVLEQQLNVTLSDIKDILSEALTLLNETETLANAGNIGEAVRVLAHVKSLVKKVEKLLEEYEDELEDELRKKGELKEYVIEKLEELNETYIELLYRYENIYRNAVEINATEAINILIEVNVTLNEISNIIIEIQVKIENEAYEEAITLINEAKDKLKTVGKLLNKVEHILSTVLETVNEILDTINELRDELEDLKEEVEESLTDELLKAALEKINEFMNYLDKAEELAENGNVDEAGKIIKEVREEIKQLSKCIDKVSDLLDEIEDLREEVNKLREEYRDNEEIQRKLDEAEKLLEEAVSALKEAIEKVSMEPIGKAKKILMEVQHILKKIEEKVLVKFEVVDTEGKMVPHATIIFDDDEYHGGQVTHIVIGTYTLEVGEIPDRYVFDHWKAEGDAEIKDVTSPTTEVTVLGECKIILVLKEKPVEEKYVITFYIKDVNGNPITDASIIFNDKECRYGETIEVIKGEYSLKAGEIPEGYDFEIWVSEGNIIIMKPRDRETRVTVNGNGTITMVLSKKVEKETYILAFLIRDDVGRPVENASIIFNGETYYNGDKVSIQQGNYTISVGEIPDNYIFSHWEISGDIEIENSSSQTTTITVRGNGEITLVLKRKTTETFTIKFYIKDINGNSISEATIIFDDDEYRDGEETRKAEGEYQLSIGEIPEGYQFKQWIASGMITITNINSSETTAIVKGDGAITLVLEKPVEVKRYTVEFYIKDINGNIVTEATILFNNTEYSSGETANVTKGTYSLSVGTIPSGYKFKLWVSEGEIIIKNTLSEDTEAIINGNGIITLVLEKESVEQAKITFYIKDTDGNIVWSASIIFDGKEYFNGQNTTVETGEYQVETGIIPPGYKFKQWKAEGSITIEDASSQKTNVVISGDGEIIMILEREMGGGEKSIIVTEYSSQIIQNYCNKKIFNIKHITKIGK